LLGRQFVNVQRYPVDLYIPVFTVLQVRLVLDDFIQREWVRFFGLTPDEIAWRRILAEQHLS
jgi:hypothetical protein